MPVGARGKSPVRCRRSIRAAPYAQATERKALLLEQQVEVRATAPGDVAGTEGSGACRGDSGGQLERVNLIAALGASRHAVR